VAFVEDATGEGGKRAVVVSPVIPLDSFEDGVGYVARVHDRLHIPSLELPTAGPADAGLVQMDAARRVERLGVPCLAAASVSVASAPAGFGAQVGLLGLVLGASSLTIDRSPAEIGTSPAADRKHAVHHAMTR